MIGRNAGAGKGFLCSIYAEPLGVESTSDAICASLGLLRLSTPLKRLPHPPLMARRGKWFNLTEIPSDSMRLFLFIIEITAPLWPYLFA